MTLRIVMVIGLLFLGQLAEAAKDEDLKKLEDILEKKRRKTDNFGSTRRGYALLQLGSSQG
ncbi:MAG: hypothetical protein ACK5TR_03520 [Alphaproteobacteria bacterium]|nr:hypothetical protein [Alphaproteobacteria bacterium]